MKEPAIILTDAIADFKPVKIILMVSGGHDSVANAHKCAKILRGWGIAFEVYHGDTTIGIPETQIYVKNICELYGWKLNIRQPPDRNWWYDRIVERFGFPGPNKWAHQFMYRRLKERALMKFVTHECKTNPRARENVLLCSGVRQQESRIRMGYQDLTNKDGSRVWCNPIFFWSDQDVKDYMELEGIPKSPVKEAICISGECLCGAWAKKEEWVEIKNAFPHVAAEIERLHEIAKANGHPWHWASGPTEWKKEQADKKQLKMNFMCVGCERRHPELDNA